jgi:hypothetical protein
MSGFRWPSRWTAAVLLIAGFFAVGGTALALMGEGFTLSNKTPKVRKDYAPIPGSNPAGQATDPTVAQCDTLPSETDVPIELKFEKEFGHLIKIQVFWEAPEADDIDIYLFDEAGELITSSASSSMPEQVQLGSPPNGTYFLCVRNFAGPNAGFTVDASTRFLDVFVPPTPQPTPTPHVTKNAPRRTRAPAPAPAGAIATGEPVDTPGPDGPFANKSLLRVAGNRQAAPTDSGLSGLEIGLAALTGLIVVSGATLVVLRIRRDTTPS